jgi:IPTL-CTERM motif
MKKAVFALVLSLWASVASAQNVSTDFEAFAGGTAAEALAVPGVTFTAAPPASWTVAGVIPGLALVSGNVIFTNPGPTVLTADFASPHNVYQFYFATSVADSIQVTGFLAGNPVFTHTFTGSIPPGTIVPEGVASGTGIVFDRLVIQAVGGLGQFVIDNFAAFGPTQVPTLSQWGLILLAGLMGIGAYATMRRQG